MFHHTNNHQHNRSRRRNRAQFGIRVDDECLYRNKNTTTTTFVSRLITFTATFTWIFQLLFIYGYGFIVHGQQQQQQGQQEQQYQRQQQQQKPTTIRINVGGGSYTDRSGQLWQGDQNGMYLNSTSNGVLVSKCPRDISATNNDDIYCSYRWFQQNSARYTIPVVQHYQYIVRLHFAELYFTTVGKRTFDVLINHKLRFSNFDTLRVCKDQKPNTAFVLSTTTTEINTNGIITIELVKRIDNPAINGIEIIPVLSSVPTPSITTTAPIKAPVMQQPPPVAAPTSISPALIRINVGGGRYTDPITGNIWQGDDDGMHLLSKSNSVVGYHCPESISETELDGLYCTYRWFRNPTSVPTQPFQYNIPIHQSNVRYTIRLHFAELYFTNVGQRIFHIYIEGTLYISNFDIVQQSKQQISRTAVVLTITTNSIISDRILTIEFIPVMNHPMINAIEIIPLPVTPPTTITPVPSPQQQPSYNIRINCGSGQSYTDPNTGKRWERDNSTIFGITGNSKTYGHTNITLCSTSISNTTEDRIYCTQRYYTTTPTARLAQYNIPVPGGGSGGKLFDVVLHFAEIYHSKAGLRMFNTLVEGNMVSTNLDIYQMVGPNTAYTITTRQRIIDGFVTIDFQSIVGEPTICGIEIIEVPISVPVAIPSMAPVLPAPTPISAPAFTDILINCGGEAYTEVLDSSRIWGADRYFIGGLTYADFSKNILGTDDDPIYETERYGEFQYEIPVPIGSYQISLHFAESRFNSKGRRLFNIDVEGKQYANVDLYSWGGMLTAFTVDTVRVVEDGAISIKFMNNNPKNVSVPKVNGISVTLVAPHFAHSVSNGPYVVVDVNNTGVVSVSVDGSNSHTHGPGLSLNQWIWKKGSSILAAAEKTTLLLPVGRHSIALTVVDTSGNSATETTTITVLPFGFPSIAKLSPNSGLIAGSEVITITGSGFTYSPSNTTVNFGRIRLSGDAIQIINSNTIVVKSPRIAIGVPVPITVQTPLGTSSPEMFTYVASSPISFTSRKLVDFGSPTVARFGPDKKLYVGTLDGRIGKLTLDGTFTKVVSQVVATVADKYAILGLAFDPLDNGETNPPVYCSASFFFHGESKSSSGSAINGRILKVGGSNLDIIETIIKGLPVSDHDHGINGIHFGDSGELYIQTGSNTNGGIPGPISGSRLQKENYFSSATIVAELSDPLFNGIIAYDREDDGKPLGVSGIEIFAPGVRNGYGIVLHSNGFLYGTDNGPNRGYGKMLMGCDGQFVEDSEQDDRLNLIQRGKYYGHPNPTRAQADKDPRQCMWRPPTSNTTESHESPLSTMFPSAGGILEYEADYFDRQMRQNLIVSRYKNALFRIILSEDGKSVIPESIPPIPFVGAAGLDATMAPNGNLIEVRLSSNSLGVHIANEVRKSTLQVYSVFPRRGSQLGGNKLTIYGTNFGDRNSTSVSVGGRSCPLIAITTEELECTLPGGYIGTVNVTVVGRAGTYSFLNGYRYVSGFRART